MRWCTLFPVRLMIGCMPPKEIYNIFETPFIRCNIMIIRITCIAWRRKRRSSLDNYCCLPKLFDWGRGELLIVAFCDKQWSKQILLFTVSSHLRKSNFDWQKIRRPCSPIHDLKRTWCPQNCVLFSCRRMWCHFPGKQRAEKQVFPLLSSV